MKAQGIVLLTLLFALAMVLINTSSALACDPDPDPEAVMRCDYGGGRRLVTAAELDAIRDPTPTPTLPIAIVACAPDRDENITLQCNYERATRLLAALNPTPTPVPVVMAVYIPKPVPPPIPRGDSPNTAREPIGAWEYIGPNTSVWYKMKDGGLRLNIWLDANGQGDLTLAIYGPDQTDLYGAPVGRGSYVRDQGHDLFWTGRSRFKGTWYALVTNYNPGAVPYKINYQRVRQKGSDFCAECHGIIVDEWDRCEHDGSFCSDLLDEYRE